MATVTAHSTDSVEAELQKMWGLVVDDKNVYRHGWIQCQVIREGRPEVSPTCSNRAVVGEKYCSEHMPRTPSRVLWFLLGAVTIFVFVLVRAL